MFRKRTPYPMLLLAALLSTLAAASAARPSARKAAKLPPGVTAASLAGKPNVLFIAVDDLNDWVGVMGGYPGVRTPNIDRLSRRGVLFSRAYAAAPACNPSRVALLTGKRPSTTGVYHNDQPWRPHMKGVVTLPEHFRSAGYHTVAGGKIHHGRYNEAEAWDTYYKPTGEPVPPNKPVNGLRAAHFDWGPVDVPDETMADMKLAGWAENYLAQTHDRPFFLGVGFSRPHLPWYVPRKYFDRFPLESIRLPSTDPNDLNDVPNAGRRMARPDGDHAKVLAAGQWEKAVQGYLASISFADECIGRVLDALDRSPYADNTIIVLWGDHGWHLGEKQHWRKFALWEEATRVPLIVSVPGQPVGGAVSGRTVNLLDVYPTLVELTGVPAREGLEGQSMAPLLKNPSAPWERPSLTTEGRNNHALRSERWRYIRYADGSEELYDHNVDPQEWTNVAGEPANREVIAQLSEWLPKVNARNVPKEGAEDSDD